MTCLMRNGSGWCRCYLPMPGRAGAGVITRMVIDGIMFRTRAGCPWRDLPGEYGNWKTVYNRHRGWSLDGTWERILNCLRAGCDEAEGADWTVSADSTVVRAHQHAASARRARAADLVVTGGAAE